MATVTTAVRGAPFTVDDLDAMPDDGHRYELLDGTLIVTPAPIWDHQAVQGSLLVLLDMACPRESRVIGAPFDWRPRRDTSLEPDVLVARYDDLVAVTGRKHLVAAPLLAVEILSPSTRRIDRLTKFAAYEEAGVGSYWIVDPDPDRTSVTAYDLSSTGRYAEVGRAEDEQELRLDRPYPLVIVPARLSDDLRPR